MKKRHRMERYEKEEGLLGGGGGGGLGKDIACVRRFVRNARRDSRGDIGLRGRQRNWISPRLSGEAGCFT